MKTLVPRPLVASGIIALSVFSASADISDNFDDNNDKVGRLPIRLPLSEAGRFQVEPTR